MTEYQERHRLSQFFGAPPGYIGYGDGSALIDTLLDHPRTVALFDEIEKAHPDVLLSLMNALDAGRITSPVPTPSGCEIDCRQAIFFFTSNWLAEAGLRRELLGRIQHFLVFRPLSLDARTEIMTLAISCVAAEYGPRVARIAPGVIPALLRQARVEGFGARPDEYLVDRVPGDCFAESARAGGSLLVEVRGPPFRCVRLDSGRTAG